MTTDRDRHPPPPPPPTPDAYAAVYQDHLVRLVGPVLADAGDGLDPTTGTIRLDVRVAPGVDAHRVVGRVRAALANLDLELRDQRFREHVRTRDRSS